MDEGMGRKKRERERNQTHSTRKADVAESICRMKAL